MAFTLDLGRLLVECVLFQGVLEEVKPIEQMVSLTNLNRRRRVHFRYRVLEFYRLIGGAACIALVASRTLGAARRTGPST